jgi:hypothetical protein
LTAASSILCCWMRQWTSSFRRWKPWKMVAILLPFHGWSRWPHGFDKIWAGREEMIFATQTGSRWFPIFALLVFRLIFAYLVSVATDSPALSEGLRE